MKRLFAMLLAILLLASLPACAKKAKPDAGNADPAPQKTEAPATEAPTEAPEVPITMENLVGTWKTEVVYDADFALALWGMTCGEDGEWTPRSEELRSILRSAADRVGPVRVEFGVCFNADGTYRTVMNNISLQEAQRERAEKINGWFDGVLSNAVPQIVAMQLREESARFGISEAEYLRLIGYASAEELIASRTTAALRVVHGNNRSVEDWGILSAPLPYEIRDGKLYCYETGAITAVGMESMLDYHKGSCKIIVQRGDRLCLEYRGIIGRPGESSPTLLPQNNMLLWRSDDMNAVFQTDDVWQKKRNNDRTRYMFQIHQNNGYLICVPFERMLKEKYESIYGADYDSAEAYAADLEALNDPDTIWENASVKEFREKYEALGFEIQYLPPVAFAAGRLKPGGRPYLQAIRYGGVGLNPAFFTAVATSFTRAN